MSKLFDALNNISVGTMLNVPNVLKATGFALLAGVLIALSYFIATRKEGKSAYFITSLIVLPSIISMIIMMVGSDIARAFSLGGVFALIRFRSEPGNPRDITYVCLTMAAGLACGTGYIGFGLLFVIIICIVFVVIKLVGVGAQNTSDMLLKVTVPEDADFETMFSEAISSIL